MSGTLRQDEASPPPPSRHWLAHGLAFAPPALVGTGILLGGGWTFLATVYGFALVAAIDQALGNRFDSGMRVGAGTQRGFELVPCLMFPVMLATVASTLWFVTRASTTTLEVAGCVVSLGTASASAGIVTAHELVHRREAWRRGLGVGLLYLVSYAHFRIEHVHGHHRNVGLRHDPVTARRGESLYAFLPRSIVGQWFSAWRIERDRLLRRGRSPIGPRNRMLWYTLVPPLLCWALWSVLGAVATLVFVAQGAIAVVLLETINYLEHYGLSRREIEPGKFEPVGPRHSWNSAHLGTDLSLFNLGRHSAHHLAAHSSYPQLDNREDWPQLPQGYPASSLLAMIPPLWRHRMDERAAHIDGEHRD